MQGRIFIGTLSAALLIAIQGAVAGLILNPPRPITHRVSVQMIETARTDGSAPATLFGTPDQRADIEAMVDAIWAQAGIDIDFLPAIHRYNDTFAYQGSGGTRPTTDLNAMIAGARLSGVLHSDPTVLNMFFVEIVPGFGALSENTAAGLAQIGENGIAQFVGDRLLDPGSHREVVASVVAHEIAHNLGLKHTSTGEPNLMSPQATSQQLSAAQIDAIFGTARRNDSIAFIPTGGTGFPKLLNLLPLAGDYNGDGVVSASDYTIWRNTRGSREDLAADGNGNRRIDDGDYTTWKSNFGNVSGGGVNAALSVPEPAAGLLAFVALAHAMTARRRTAARRGPC